MSAPPVSKIFSEILREIPDFLSFKLIPFEIFANEKMEIIGRTQGFGLFDGSQLTGYNYDLIHNNLLKQYQTKSEPIVGCFELKEQQFQLEEDMNAICEMLNEWDNIIKPKRFIFSATSFEELLTNYKCLAQFRELKLKVPEIGEQIDCGLNNILRQIRTIRREVSEGKRIIKNKIQNYQNHRLEGAEQQIEFLDIFGQILCNIFKQFFYICESKCKTIQTVVPMNNEYVTETENKATSRDIANQLVLDSDSELVLNLNTDLVPNSGRDT